MGAYVGVINTILWLIWSIIKTFISIEDNGKKFHSFVANIFGLLLCLSQLGLYYLYKKDDIKDNERPLNEKGIDDDSDTGNNLKTFVESENSEEKKIEDEFI